MPGRNKTELVGWHPPAEIAAWLNHEVERTGAARGAKSTILTEALYLYRAFGEAVKEAGEDWPAALKDKVEHMHVEY